MPAMFGSGPNFLVSGALQVELGSAEPWPKDVKLFQPFEVEQVLLHDNANCLAVQALLHMLNLNFTVEMRRNAEHMSPSGKLPFIQANRFVIADLEPVVEFINTKGISLTEHLDSTQKTDIRAYMTLASSVLGNAELFVSWKDDVTFTEVTKPRYGSVYPWPLNIILTWKKRYAATKRLAAIGWGNKTLEDVYTEVERCCQTLNERLDGQLYFFNNKPTELDALVFGHLFAILTTLLPDDRLACIIRQFKNLIDLCQHVENEFFRSSRTSSRSSDNFEKIA